MDYEDFDEIDAPSARFKASLLTARCVMCRLTRDPIPAAVPLKHLTRCLRNRAQATSCRIGFVYGPPISIQGA